MPHLIRSRRRPRAAGMDRCTSLFDESGHTEFRHTKDAASDQRVATRSGETRIRSAAKRMGVRRIDKEVRISTRALHAIQERRFFQL
jgi:hypothetical protein